jgi:hypothetical protein
MPTRILTIGNSFAENATRYLEDLSAADGRGDLVLGKANLGGCSLEKHWNLVRQCDLLPEVRPYNLVITGQPSRPATLREALTALPWDLVSLQQVSHESWRPETYQPHLSRLAALVRELAPQAQVVLHQTWAYRVDGPSLAVFGLDQTGMFQKLQAAYAGAAAELGCRILPCGLAFQKARAALRFVPDAAFDYQNPTPLQLPDQRRSLIRGYAWATGNTRSGNPELHMDERHGNARGCYLANAVWYEMIFGRLIADNPFLPEGVTPDERTLLQAAAHAAVMEAGGPLVFP